MKRLVPFPVSQNVRTLIGGAVLALAVVGCGPGADSTGSAGMGGAGTGGAGTGACDVQKLFTQTYSCTLAGCHTSAMGTMPAAGFDMSVTGWETTMIGKPPPGGGTGANASVCVGMGKTYLVAKSQPATGLFLDKMKMSPPCGMRMPNIPLLTVSSADLACIQSWANNLTK